ncbi:MAG TPA: alpha-amylase family glycosyl hydrolase, partial [Propionibacteriaceae bacterium]|nr:alpha-amylase family glycosyl hydrolase [Propionibacteriaceae bacterium]
MPSALNKITQPFIYEINTWPWLAEISHEEGGAIDLGSVPDRYWDEVADLGFDGVWLMGVWQRSSAGVAIALSNDDLRASFAAALPDWQTSDVVGSPYCVRDYVVDDHFGGRNGLASAREALAERGMGLIVDFVPNHVAPDHPWTTLQPELFVSGTSEDLRNDPASFVEIAGRVLANGRDPYFPAWPDVVQLNAFAPALRVAVIETLIEIGEQCDGVRCDMAMLVMNEVFAHTWRDRVGPAPESDYWPTVINAVRDAHPGFVFLAEAYWDLEWSLQQQGFNYCYDKRLYDRILQGPAEQVRLHLLADDQYQHGLVRFVENHDEPRAASAFGSRRSQVAAVTALSQTGARLVHNGQLEGVTVHLPVFLGRYPVEPTDSALLAFYRSLLPALADPTFRHGQWQLCDRSGWPGDDRYQGLVAWCWEGDARWLIVVNLSDGSAPGLVRTPWADLRGRQW